MKTKDSGYKWIGHIPNDWEIAPIKAIAKRKNESNQPDLMLLSVYRDYGVVPKDSRDDNHNRASEDLSNYKVVKKNNLVLNKMKTWQGSLAVSDYEGIVSPAYIICELAESVFPKYIHFLLRSKNYIDEYLRISYGIRIAQWDMHYEDFRFIPVILPSLEEQQNIAEFLDIKISQIDIAITKKQKLIELLQEKRKSLIDEAVTKGLNRKVPMKDSRVEWLGNVPAHWQIRKLKTVAVLKSGESITYSEIDTESRYPVYGGNGLRGYTSAFTHNGDYILIGRQGALCGNVRLVTGYFWASEHAVVITPTIDLDILWLEKFLVTMNLNQYSESAAQPGLSVERIKNLHICIPPKEEQREISSYIITKVTNIDNLVVKLTLQIEKLHEYRVSLISEAVTGKIDVR